MPTTLSTSEHLAVIADTGARFHDYALRAGWDSPVITCPAWDVRALVAHQTMVHRWATAVVTGGDPDAVPNQTTIRSEVDDLSTYYLDGLDGLLEALRTMPVDQRAMTFLNDAPPPRAFWARRQAHEVTIHTVDALSALLGRLAETSEVELPPEVAVDGIDEILRGFFTRGRSKLFAGEPEVVVVTATDADRRWVVRIDEKLSVDQDDADHGDLSAASFIEGTAAAVDLALWNRGSDVAGQGAIELLDRWRKANRVSWS